jgi:hypothetical protein
VAGDTTPCSVISFLYYMSVNASVQARLIQEIREKIGDKGVNVLSIALDRFFFFFAFIR